MDNPLKIERRILFIALGLLAVGIALLFVFSNESAKPTQPLPEVPKIMEISGWVSDINVSNNSFTITSRKDEVYEIILGRKTELKEYLAPAIFSFHNSSDASLEQAVPTTLQELKKGDQVAITASSPIYSGKEIEEPVEIKIFH